VCDVWHFFTFKHSTLQASNDSFSGTLGKSSKSGTMAKLTYNLRYVTLKSSEGVLRYHENHSAFSRCVFLHRKSKTIFDRPQWCRAQGRVEPENRFPRVLCRSRGPAPRRHARYRTQVYIPVYQTHNFLCCSVLPTSSDSIQCTFVSLVQRGIRPFSSQLLSSSPLTISPKLMFLNFLTLFDICRVLLRCCLKASNASHLVCSSFHATPSSLHPRANIHF
jgi:hypothetical protein